MAANIEFYFDLSSPYGYLAAERIDDLAARHGRGVDWRPYLMGAVYRVNGMKPLVDIPLIDDYSRLDIARCAREQGLRLSLPEGFPYGAVAGCRACYWLHERDPARARALALALMRAYFGEGRPVATAEEVAAVAAGLGVDGAELQSAVQRQAVKDRLRAETDTAIERGVFGSPFFFIDGEPFFGNDRFEQMDRWLASGGW